MHHDPPRAAAARRGRIECRGTATRTARRCANAPESTSPQNTPIGRHSQPAAQEARPADGADHHDHEQRDREQQRVAVGAVAERRGRRPAAAASRPRSGGSRCPRSGRSWPRRTTERPTYQKNIGSGQVERGVHRARRRRCSPRDGTCARSTLVVVRRAARAPGRAAAGGAACFTFHRPVDLLDHELRVGRAPAPRAAAWPRRLRARRSAPGTRRRCWWSTPMRSLTAASRVGGVARRVEHDRADRRRARVPARRRRREDRRPSSRRSPSAASRHQDRAAVVAVRRSTGPRALPDLLHFGRRDRQVAALARRADQPRRRRRPVPARDAARSRATSAGSMLAGDLVARLRSSTASRRRSPLRRSRATAGAPSISAPNVARCCRASPRWRRAARAPPSARARGSRGALVTAQLLDVGLHRLQLLGD